MKTKLLKSVAFILALASIFTVSAFAVDNTQGDINSDGSVTNVDLLLVANHCVGICTLSEEQQDIADVNNDGVVSNPDVIGIARLVIGLDANENTENTENNENNDAEVVTKIYTVKSAQYTPADPVENEPEEPEVNDEPEVVEEPVETTEPEKWYTDDDVYWLSHIIYAEAGGESYEGMVAVGNVVLNRMKSSSFPNTIYGVIFQKYQFTPASSGSIYRTPSATAVKAAIAALEGENVVGGALYFNSVKTSSWASRNATFVKRIGNHNFYK